jgi:aminopeptidase YwaD
MTKNDLLKKSCEYLKTLCEDIPERCVGSNGNRKATSFFSKLLESYKWQIDVSEFDAIDWNDDGAKLTLDDEQFQVLVSPYSLGCNVKAELASATTIDALREENFEGKILFLHGEIAKEQLMPKNFVFYNPIEHQKIIALLEKSGAEAIICATGRNAALAGGVYPFPLIEDGDFNIPSVYMTEEEGKKLEKYIGKQAHLLSRSERFSGKSYNVIGRKNPENKKRIVISAHIDAKKGTPGAIDNATGVIVLLLLAELLKDYAGDYQLEMVAFNGEDYYCAPGQMKYLQANQGKFDSILLNINIDGAGYKDGKSSFSLFDLPDNIQTITETIIDEHEDIGFAEKWYQGDHSIFLQHGCPAIAISSQWFVENIDLQDITHTPKDNVDIVDCRKIIDIAKALQKLIHRIA